MLVEVRPELMKWARERAGLEIGVLSAKYPKYPAWEKGESRPTLKQLENIAKATHAPIGYFFLPSPPVEKIPLPDFRTMGLATHPRPSPDLLETLYACQERQEWMKERMRLLKEDPLDFVGSLSVGSDAVEAAEAIRKRIGLGLEERARTPTWTEALRAFIEKADGAGILTMCSGVVGNNNRRRLDPGEFRGFAIADGLAPLVFINGADSKAAQGFTLAHELAHIWLGESALSDAGIREVPSQAVEAWCNRVAAEILVPLGDLVRNIERAGDPLTRKQALAKRYKVSSLVILRRLFDAGALNKEEFQAAYEAEEKLLRELPKSSGGSFYLTEAARVGRSFARALVSSVLEGQTLYRDAFRMLGISKIETFHEFGRSLKVM